MDEFKSEAELPPVEMIAAAAILAETPVNAVVSSEQDAGHNGPWATGGAWRQLEYGN